MILLENLDELFQDQVYLKTMYQALFSTLYFGLFRIGELTFSDHIIKAKDVHVGKNKMKLMFILHTSKTHWRDVKPQIVKISAQRLTDLKDYGQKVHSKFCPFHLLQCYLWFRKSHDNDVEPFFVFRDRTLVTPTQARNVLQKLLLMSGLDPTLYGCQSMRAGHATDLAEFLDLESVKRLGRWKSNCVFAYLKQ